MSAAILRFEPRERALEPPTPPTPQLEAVFGRAGVERLYQASPLRLMLPRIEAGEPPTAIIVNTAGGVVAGDRLGVSIAVGPHAAALVTTQAAEKIYRSTGAEARIETTLAVAPGGWLEWLPQETILYDRSRLWRSLEAEVAPGGRLLAGELLVLGRTAHGERLTNARLLDGWRLRRAGRLVWADGLAFDDNAMFAATAGFGGAVALATIAYVGDDARAWLDFVRGLSHELGGHELGVTVIGDLLLVRMLGPDAQKLRRTHAAVLAALRHAIAGRPRRLPSIWEGPCT